MRKSGFTKFLAVALICVSTFAGRAEAVIPVADGASTTNTLKDWFNTIKETKFVTDTVAFANKTSAAIGDAKKSVTDYVIKNKEAAEEKIKKLKEYKDQVDAYKAEYAEYRQMLDENIAAANKLKADAQNKLAEAQRAKTTIQGALGEESKLPDDTEDGGDAGLPTPGDTGGSRSASDGNPSDSASAGSPDTAVNGGGSSALSGAPTGSIGQTSAVAPMIRGTSGSNYVSAPVLSSRQRFSGGSSAGTVSDNVSSPAPLTANETAALAAAKAKIAAGETLTPDERQLVDKADRIDLAAQKSAVAAIKAKLAAGNEISEEERALLAKDYADEAAALKTIEEKLAAGETLTAEEQALLTEKTAEDEAKQEKLAAMSEEELREKLAALDQAKLDSWSDEFLYTREELEANLKAKDEAKKASLTNENAYTREELEKNLKAKDEAKRSSLGIRTRATTRDIGTRAPQRRTFSSGRRAFLDSGSLQGFAAVSGDSRLAFAFALQLPDDGTDVNKTYLVSKTINKTCDLTSQKAMEAGVMDECLVNILDKLKEERAFNEVDFQKNYNQGRKEYAAALIAEGNKLKNDADNFSFDILDKIDYAPGTQTIDHYAHLVEMNKQVVTVINGLLKTHSSRLLLNTYSNYGSYDFSTPSEDDTGEG